MASLLAAVLHAHLGCTQLCPLRADGLCRALWRKGRWPEQWPRRQDARGLALFSSSVMTAALTTGQLWAGRHAAGLFVCLMVRARVLLPSCLAQQAKSSAGLSPHPEGSPRDEPALG